MVERRVTWAYRTNERGHRLGGYVGVIRVRESRSKPWRERFRCDHAHVTRTQATACAEELKGLA